MNENFFRSGGLVSFEDAAEAFLEALVETGTEDAEDSDDGNNASDDKPRRGVFVINPVL